MECDEEEEDPDTPYGQPKVNTFSNREGRSSVPLSKEPSALSPTSRTPLDMNNMS